MDNNDSPKPIKGTLLENYVTELGDILNRVAVIGQTLQAEMQAGQPVEVVGTTEPALTAQANDRRLADRASEMLARRRWRDRCFGSPELLGEPTWDILLDLYVNHVELIDVSVSSAAYASVVPLTTGLRYIEQLEKKGWVTKEACENDRRRSFLRLTPLGLSLMRRALSDY